MLRSNFLIIFIGVTMLLVSERAKVQNNQSLARMGSSQWFGELGFEKTWECQASSFSDKRST